MNGERGRMVGVDEAVDQGKEGNGEPSLSKREQRRRKKGFDPATAPHLRRNMKRRGGIPGRAMGLFQG